MLKKTLKWTGITLLVLVTALLLTPFLFKKQILNLVKKEINGSLTARVDFADVDISFLRSFPRVSVRLENLDVVGKDEFAKDTLLHAGRIDAAVNLTSFFKGKEYKIYSVIIDEPRIHALVHANGKANWDITRPDTSTTTTASEASPFRMNLEKYAIHKGYIEYRDEQAGMSSEIVNLEHEGSGDFTSDLFTLHTNTSADAVSFTYEGVPYLAKAKTHIGADIQVDNKASKYSFKTGDVLVNDLKLSTEGFFAMPSDSVYAMDIAFKAPSTDFKNILSLIPAIYQKDFASVKTSGSALFEGFVRGNYSETQMPAYNVNLEVKDGFFQYPDLPLPVKNINLSLKVNNPDGVTDHTVVNIPKGHVEMGTDPFDFHLLVEHPVSDMFVDAGAQGRMDLGKIPQLVKLDAGTKLKGLLDADLAVKGKVSAMQRQDLDGFTASGALNLSDFLYASKDYPDGVSLKTVKARFNPKNITLDQLDGQYLKTNFQAHGSLDNLLAYVLKNQPLRGNLDVQADQLNLNDWMSTSTDTAAATTAASGPFLVPGNLDFTLTSKVDRVHYDQLDLDALSGSLHVNDETVYMKDVHANALEGTMLINGSYSTKLDKKRPDISLSYDVQGLDVQKTFYAFVTVQKLMPVGKFISGKMSSKLTLTGKLGEGMMPDLASLTGNGNLFLIEGFLKKFAPVDKLASTLNVQQLQDISLKDVKNYIEFTNGKVLVKPFNVKVKDIDMEIGGMHGFDQSLDYVINMKLPRALMGSQGNKLVDNLVAEAGSRGVAIKTGDVVNLKVNMGGTVTDPKIRTDLKATATSLAADLKQQATDFAKAKIDSSKKMVKDTMTAIKTQVVAAAKEELVKKLTGTKDSTATGTPVNAEELKKKAENTGKAVLKGLFKKG